VLFYKASLTPFGGYDLNYILWRCIILNLGAYYEAINVSDSHNYYMGQAKADITKWVGYFTEGMAISFKSIVCMKLDFLALYFVSLILIQPTI